MARLGKGAGATAGAETASGTARPAKASRPAGSRVARFRPSGGSFVGLDIGTQTIKAVEVKGSGAGLQVVAIAVGNTPPDAFEGGLIVNPKALGATIKALLAKNGIRARKAVSAAAGTDAVVVRVIEVQKMNPAELAETMKWEIERHIPFSANDVELSFQTIDDPETIAANTSSENMEVLLAVARRDMVAQHLNTIQAAGLNAIAIDIEALAVGRSLLDLSKRQLQTKNVVIVNIGATMTEVGVFKAGLLRFPRIIPIAGENITRAISDRLGISMEDAEDEKRKDAVVLMELLGAAQNDDIFNDPFGQEQAPPPPAAEIRSRFDVPVIAPPPVFGAPSPFATPIAEEPVVAAPVADDPFAAASTYDPFANTAQGFDLDDSVADTASHPMAAPPVPAPDNPHYRRQREIFDAILPVLSELSMEVSRSIDYFRSRYPNDTVDKIILCGGSAALGKLDEYIQQQMGVPTEVANPFAGLTVASRQISSDRLAALAPSLSVAVGLAVRDAVIGAG